VVAVCPVFELGLLLSSEASQRLVGIARFVGKAVPDAAMASEESLGLVLRRCVPEDDNSLL
jgi:hypothetical protein